MSQDTKAKNLIGVSIGDYNGIGPEVLLKTVADTRILRQVTPIVYASAALLTQWSQLLEMEAPDMQEIAHPSEANPKKLNIIRTGEENPKVEPGLVTAAAGAYARASLFGAVADLKAGATQGIVTLPINKDNIQSDDFRYPGHTEYLAAEFGVKDNLMFLVDEGLRVGVVTGHVPISGVSTAVTRERVLSKLQLMHDSLRQDFGIQRPRIALLGLNPHAGENGLIGKEEETMLIPIIKEQKEKGMLVFGPYPADGFFGRGDYVKFDGVLAMYHDQGLIPFKTLAFYTGVNYTAGMPVVRTSPDHGTAYDIAGKGVADEKSFRNALYLCADVVKLRTN